MTSHMANILLIWTATENQIMKYHKLEVVATEQVVAMLSVFNCMAFRVMR